MSAGDSYPLTLSNRSAPVLAGTAYQEIENLRIELMRASLKEGSELKHIVDVCLSKLPGIARYELFSVYILDHLGEMKRVGAQRASGGEIPDLDVFPAQAWVEWPGPSASSYRDAVVLEEISASDPLKHRFEEVAGPLSSVVRLPLNGASQTFGFLEAANGPQPFSSRERHSDQANGDLPRLFFATSMLAGSISSWRSRNELLALAEITYRFTQAEIAGGSGNGEVQEIFDEALAAALKRLVHYRLVVLRIGEDGDSLTIRAKAKDDDLSWEGWKDINLKRGEYLAGQVIETGKFRTIPDIEKEPGLFTNLEWLLRARVRSCACCPLLSGGRPIGTLTIYTAFRYEFPNFDVCVLTAISSASAMVWERLKAQRQRSEAEEEMARLRTEIEERHVGSAREAAILPYQTLLHRVKDSWNSALRVLREGEPSAIDKVISIGEPVDRLLKSESILHKHEPQTFDVFEAVSAIITAKQTALRGSSITLLLEAVQPLPSISMPPSLFNEILYNLLSNSERAVRSVTGRKGRIEIRVAVEKGDLSDDLVITVKDNGVGIPEEKLDRIFEEGYTTFSKSGGIGFGLFVTSAIVRKYGGSIVPKSEIGKGTTFTVRLPLSWIKP